MKLKAILLTILISIVYTYPFALSAQSYSSMYIYGTVTTIDGDEFTGQLRWGKEEGYWTDMFNTSKIDNIHYDNLSRKDQQLYKEEKRIRERGNSDDFYLFGFSGRGFGRWNNYEIIHQFSSRFGDIAKLTYLGRQRVEIELKNGDIIPVKGQGFNDIGGKIHLFNPRIGKIRFQDEDIRQISFSSAPQDWESTWGTPLIGRVFTESGTFNGLIQWDKEERFSKDVLNGENEDGEYDISFESIASIQKDGSGSLVTLLDGKEIFLRGTNDVNRENRGIIVYQQGLGRIEIPWEAFVKVEFFVEPSFDYPSYEDFSTTQANSGIVVLTDDTRISGQIAFDLDELYDVEMLNGEIDKLDLEIPFRNIQSIRPLTANRTEIVLVNDQKVLLDNERDVSNSNDGLLVYLSSGKSSYIPWIDVAEIILGE